MERAGRATTVAVADCLSHRRRRRRRRWSSTDYVRSRPLSLFPPYSVPRYRVAGRRYCSTAERTDGEREGPDTHGTHSLTRAYVTSRYTKLRHPTGLECSTHLEQCIKEEAEC